MKIKIRALEYHLADHCNLNCAGCTHFSPIAKPHFASLERFEENLKKLKEWNFEIGQFNLLGGEPLLHSQVREFIEVAHKYLTCLICIKTNGILLTDDFIKFCDETNTRIIMTDYGVSKYKNPSMKADKFMCHFISAIPKNNTMCGDISFKRKYENSCSQLEENGDLHFCGYSANIKHYNSYYETSIPVRKDEDFFNIYDTSLKRVDIWKKFLLKRPFCDYCCLPVMKPWHRYDGTNEWKAKI